MKFESRDWSTLFHQGPLTFKFLALPLLHGQCCWTPDFKLAELEKKLLKDTCYLHCSTGRKMIGLYKKNIKYISQNIFFLTFQRLPHSLHSTKVVIGSSALRVCTCEGLKHYSIYLFSQQLK